jgi:hypothetical protein
MTSGPADASAPTPRAAMAAIRLFMVRPGRLLEGFQ